MLDKTSPQNTQSMESVTESQKQTIATENPNQPSTQTTEPKNLSTDSKQKSEAVTFSENACNFCEFTHEYLRQYIELADQKAAFLFAIVSAIPAYIITSKISPFAVPFNWDISNWAHISGKASLFLFLISSIACILVVLPRLRQKNNPGLIFWEEIVAVNSADDYAKMICNNNAQDASYEIATHAYSLASVCNRKYFWLKIGMYTALAAFSFFAYYLWPILPTLAKVLTQ